jgi:hypothetical protein
LQLQLSPISKDRFNDHNVSDVNTSSLRIRQEDTLEVVVAVVANHLKESAISALQAPEIYVPITTVVSSSLTDHRGAVRTLAESRKKFTIKIPKELRAMDGVTELGAARNPLHTSNWTGIVSWTCWLLSQLISITVYSKFREIQVMGEGL